MHKDIDFATRYPDWEYNMPEHDDNEILSFWRREIFLSIESEGILSAQYMQDHRRLFIGSKDKFAKHNVEGVVLQKRDFGTDWNTLYRGGHSCMSVAGERDYTINDDHGKTINPLLQSRYNALFLVVSSKIHRLCINTVMPEEIDHFILPEEIYNELDVSSNKVIVTREKINRNIGLLTPKMYLIPDFELPLLKLFEINKRLWVHSVRLPTVEDLNHYLARI